MAQEEFHDVFPLVLCLVLAIQLSHVVHCRRISFLTEATVSLLVGLLAGGGVVAYFIWVKGGGIPTSLTEFNTELFFDALLPPIIFNAGFSAKKKSLFRNFTTLALFGVVGTFMTAGMIATGVHAVLARLGLSPEHRLRDSLALGTVFSSSDSVAALQILDPEATPVLYSLVFGEGVVNDASAIVLLRAVEKISRSSQLNGDTLLLICGNFMRLFTLSLLLGVGVGLFSALLIKRSFAHHSTDREVTLVGLLGFLAYVLAEEMQLSGIFSVFFCGITMSHYTWYALSPSAKVVTVYLFRILSFTSELFLFLYAGFSMWSSALWRDLAEESKSSLAREAMLLAAALVGLVLLARALTIGPLALLANTWRPPGSRITLGQGAVIWWSGSIRGAITVAMAFKSFASDESRDSQVIVVASNTAVIFFTVVLGGITSRLIKWMLSGESNLQPQSSALSTYPSLSPEGVSAPLLTTALRRHLHWNHKAPIYTAWHKLDAWLYPIFGGRATRAPGYRSPPPSPGRRVINRVMGPSILKRHTPPPDGSLPVSHAEGSRAVIGGLAAAPQPPASGVPAAPTNKPPRHPDPFRLWPAPTHASAPAAALPGLMGRDRRVSFDSTSAADSTPPPRASQRGGQVEGAAELQPTTSLEELFSFRSGRLDSAASQQVDWRDSAEYGEDAFLAAGAPGVDEEEEDRQSSGDLESSPQQAGQGQAAAVPSATGAPECARTSPFEDTERGRNSGDAAV